MSFPKIKNQNIGFNFDNSYAMLPEHFFTRMAPVSVLQPRIVVINKMLSQELGLDIENHSEEYLASLFSGNRLPEGSDPISQAYAGHQFGHFTYLGDGRAHLIGEHKTPDGRRVDIQLKGSGQTAYGQRADGRAALGPMLREYIMSEAMHALGIPTTRSLAVVTTGELVYRETPLPGAILTRVASSHLRIGTFEYFLAKKDVNGLKTLADYTIARHYAKAKQSDQPYLTLLKMVIEQQANLMVHWMRVGFIHGVMNTDNMALSGETIDYGPCAFMDAYDPDTVFSSIDYRGRYRYTNQPMIAQWNLARFAETLVPIFHEHIDKAIQLAEEAVNAFPTLFQNKWQAMMRAKLGLFGEQKNDSKLFAEILDWMHQHKADYTNTFRDLSREQKSTDKLYDNNAFQNWSERWQVRLKENNKPLKSSLDLMNASNPAVIPRNHQVNQSLDSALNGDIKPFNDLLSALAEPYTDSPDMKSFQSPPTESERVHETFCGT